MMLTVEEMTMMKSFDHSTRGAAIADLALGIAGAVDPDLKNSCMQLREKLAGMSDADYMAIDFTVYDEELA